MPPKGKFHLDVIDTSHLIFSGDVEALFLRGDESEFELLPHHYPLLSVLKRGKIVIDWKRFIPIKKGAVRFHKNECTIVMEPDFETLKEEKAREKTEQEKGKKK